MTTLTVGLPLDADHVVAVDRLLRRLQLPVPRRRFVPHVSVLVLHDVADLAGIGRVMRAVADRTTPFSVAARGLALFQEHDNTPVLYVPVARTAALSHLHAELVGAAEAMGMVVDGHYEPDNWFPHVTLTDRDLTPSQVPPAVQRLLGGRPVAWTLRIARFIELASSGPIATAAFGGLPVVTRSAAVHEASSVPVSP